MTEPRPAADPLAEAALRPLAHQSAAREDAATVLGGIARNKVDPSAAADRWQSIDRSPLVRHGPRIWLGLCLALSLLPVLLTLLPQSATLWREARLLTASKYHHPYSSRPEISSQDPLLPHLSLHEHSAAALASARHLLTLDPENPAYLAEHAVIHLGHRGTLPPDFLATASHLDPDNAFFLLLAAAALAEEAVRRNPASRSALSSALQPREQERRVFWDFWETVAPADEIPHLLSMVETLGPRPASTKPPDPEQARFEILDPEKHRAALDLIERASRLPAFRSYSAERRREILGRLPSGYFADEAVRHAYMFRATRPLSPLYHLEPLIGAEAERLAQAGDVRGWRELEETIHRCSTLLLEDEVTDSLNEWTVTRHLSSSSGHLWESAAALGIEPRYRDWQALFTSTERTPIIRPRERQPEIPYEPRGRHRRIPDLPFVRMPVYLGHSVDSSLLESPFEHPDYVGLRKAQQFTAAGLLAATSWLVMLATLTVLVVAIQQHDRSARFLGTRVAALLRAGDHGIIFALGVALPALLIGGIAYLSPYGGPQETATFAHGRVKPAQWAVFGILLLVWTGAVASWRLRRRAAALRFPRPQTTVMIAVSILAFGMLFALGQALVEHKPEQEIGWINFAILVCALPCALLPPLLSLYGGTPHTVFRVACCRAMLPSLSTALLLAAVAAPLLLAESRRGLESEPFLRTDPARPAITAFDHHVALQLREAVRAAHRETPPPAPEP